LYELLPDAAGEAASVKDAFEAVERWWNVNDRGLWVDFCNQAGGLEDDERGAPGEIVLIESPRARASLEPLAAPVAPVAAQRMPASRRPLLALTRATGFNDGFGAQLQRVLAVYCICREYGFDYVHTPLEDIEYQGLRSLLSGNNSAAFVAECNERIRTHLPSDVPPEEAATYKPIDSDLSLEQLQQTSRMLARQLVRSGGEAAQRALVRYRLPYVVSDAHVHVYRHARGLFRTRLPRDAAHGRLTIGMHVRRGELHLVDSERMLPNEFYVRMARHAVRACEERGVEYALELYTEVAEEETEVSGFANGRRLDAPVTFTPAMSRLSDFDALGERLRRYVNEPLLDTFDRMINADVLIASRSSLSACASYLKHEGGVTVYHPFWHSMADTDIPCDDPDLPARLLECVDRFKGCAH